jgi:hypothetical protein
VVQTACLHHENGKPENAAKLGAAVGKKVRQQRSFSPQDGLTGWSRSLLSLTFKVSIPNVRSAGGSNGCRHGCWGSGVNQAASVGRCAFVTEEMGSMRAKSIWQAGLLAFVLAAVTLLTPRSAQAQILGYAPPDFAWPIPWGSTRPEDGGVYIGSDFLLWRQTVPLRNQVVATRGFYDINSQDAHIGQFGGATFIGSGTVALDTNQVRGPGSYQPGFNIHIGYKFPDESTITFSWLYLFQQRYQAVATAVPPNFNFRGDFADTFLTAPVFNFPNDFAGLAEQQNSGITGPNGLPLATYGIWDGASLMTESFVQRTQMYDIIWRKPLFETECYRMSSLCGPRFFWIWENYLWRTTNFGFTGSAGPSATYTNIDSNRMYGLDVGCSQEWYLGQGFACQLDTEVTGYLNIIKERTQYSTERKFNGSAESKRARTDYTVVPAFDAKLSLMWYPIENVQLNLGYDVMAFFNTVNAQVPIDFNYSSVDPKFDRVFRLFDGLTASIVIVF